MPVRCSSIDVSEIHGTAQQQRIPHCHCGPGFVIAGQALSLRATTRNPVVARQWIPDQVRDDSH
jgi:hypothetical protein